MSMPLVKPFTALCPAPGRAAEVLAPPYDVMNAAEARRLAAGRPLSFLHVSRAEIDLPEDTDPHAPEVYAQARLNLDRLRREGVLRRDPVPGYRVYRLTWEGRAQTGLMAGVSLDAYASGRVKRHEFTRPVKEDDRVRHIETLDAQTGPVLLAYRAAPGLDGLLAGIAAAPPEVDCLAPDGVRHQLWPVLDPAAVAAIDAAAGALPALYIADGHHRCAAAARVAASRRAAAPASAATAAAQYALAVLFPHDQLRILAYNRLIRDLNGLTPAELIARLAVPFEVAPADAAVNPERPGVFGLYTAGRWYRLRLPPERLPAADPVARLDVSLLQDLAIAPILGIADPRRDERIDFVGGVRGLEALATRVDSGEMAAAFALHPTGIEDLMAVADSGAVMPPKSTWFEPKLADGLASHVLDGD